VRTAIFLSARHKATRLPGKLLLEIAGRPALEHLIARLKTAGEPDLLILTTSTHAADDVLVEVAGRNAVPAFRGSEDDKLDRYRQAASAHDVEFAAVVDGDDLFCAPEYVDRAIQAYRRTGADYVTARGLPVGAACFGVSARALERVCALKAETETEVWGGYFTDTGLFEAVYVEAEPDVRRPEYRMTLDYPEDLAFFRAVFERLHAPGSAFTLRDIVALLDAHPEIVDVNREAARWYEAHLKRAAPVRLGTVP
jgi:spore coat polysaccharide biosynthesis protein SpsF